jgi:hypothetical protein
MTKESHFKRECFLRARDLVGIPSLTPVSPQLLRAVKQSPDRLQAFFGRRRLPSPYPIRDDLLRGRGATDMKEAIAAFSAAAASFARSHQVNEVLLGRRSRPAGAMLRYILTAFSEQVS